MLRTTSAYLNQSRVVRQFYSAGKMPRGEQMALWSALIGLEEKQRQFADERWRLRRQIDRLTAALKQSQKNEDKPMRAAVRRVKQVLKRAPYYSTVSAAVKQLKGKAA
jgi:hypothetical protein